MDQSVLALHIFATFFMCGLIWLVQLVHYPGFLYVAPERYGDFQSFHMSRITRVVLPVMLLELTSGIFLSYQLSGPVWLINLVLLLLIWCSTFLIQSPLHVRLKENFDAALVTTLIRGNWIRTVLWTVRALILLVSLNPVSS